MLRTVRTSTRCVAWPIGLLDTGSRSRAVLESMNGRRFVHASRSKLGREVLGLTRRSLAG